MKSENERFYKSEFFARVIEGEISAQRSGILRDKQTAGLRVVETQSFRENGQNLTDRNRADSADEKSDVNEKTGGLFSFLICVVIEFQIDKAFFRR